MKQMKQVRQSVIAVAVFAATSSWALAATPPTGAKATAQVDLAVIPTAVTCQIDITDGNGGGVNNNFLWNVGLAESGTGSVVAGGTSLKRDMNINFTSPANLKDPNDPTADSDIDCTTAGDGLKLSFKASHIDSTPVQGYEGMINSHDDTRWFNYAVAVSKSAFENAVKSAAATTPTGTASVDWPGTMTSVGDLHAFKLDGTEANAITINNTTPANGGDTPPLSLGRYPIQIHLQQDYTTRGLTAPKVYSNAADNVYRGHFTITATYL